MYANLAITMLLGGLWHGASWNFVIWGGLHGVALALHKWFAGALQASIPKPIRAVLGWATTYAFVCMCWIFFRAESLASAMYIVRKIVGLEPGGASWTYAPLFLLLPLVIAAHIVGRLTEHRPTPAHAAPSDDGTPSHVARFGWIEMHFRPGFATAFVLTFWVIALYLFAPLRTSPFIYFQF
jgi:alginate O-acetyltransferase complex protein AlgI